LRGSAERLAVVIGTGFGSGYFPIFPGTVGSVVGIGVYLVLLWLGVLSDAFGLGWPITLGVIFLVGVPSARRCEAMFGDDSKRIVIDEVWGMLIAVLLLPATWKWVLAAFVLFRFFDVVKPFPARRFERVGGGYGVMLDDGVAGAYANVVLQGLRIFLA
jgi:phosphatidylglycerophosphatase A